MTLKDLRAEDRYERHTVPVLDTYMSYIDEGEGDPVVFLHGNPTFSYLWRNVIPHVEGKGRCLAPDLVGMGRSGKNPAGSYAFLDHARYLDAWFEELDLQNVTLVIHDWGSALGFYWAHRHPERVKGIVYMEAIVQPVTWEQWPPAARPIFRALRSTAGEALILKKNIFVERILPSAVIRELTDEEMAHYRQPFLEAGESRRPTLTWPRQIPVEGEPREVVEIVDAYGKWLATSSIPKLFINADPGSILIGEQREFCRTWANQEEITVKGDHFIQEDSPVEIGRAVAQFIDRLHQPQRLNRQVLLVSRPTGMPTDDNFSLIHTVLPAIAEGEVLVRTLYLSVDPYMRGRMSDVKSYVAPFELGKVLTGGVVGRIEESKNERFEAGDLVVGLLGWQDYSISDGRGLAKINPELAPITTALGILGMPGLTAYFGLLDIGNPKAGETVVISGAAGAVGSIVGQIAKIKGCRVVGIAGQDDKIEYLINELGFDAAINYNTVKDMGAALKEACPNGVDVYFDNVGGDITDQVMKRINYQARVVICGQIAAYNLARPDIGPRVFTQLLKKSAMAKGFIQSDYSSRTKEGLTQLAEWLRDGKLHFRESIVDGLENAQHAFLGLFKGENIGKQLVKVYHDPDSNSISR